MTNTQYRRLIAGLIAVWFVAALSASALHLFRNDPPTPPIALGLGVLAPILVFGLWYAASPGFRQFTQNLNLRTLTIVQTWRVVGFALLTLYAYRVLPGIFAWPAGLGDMAIGVTAPLMAMKLSDPAYRQRFVRWQWLGMLDLVVAVSLGTTAGWINPHGVPTTAMTMLPLSLMPTFGVPLFFILHVISVAQTRQRSEYSYTGGQTAQAHSV